MQTLGTVAFSIAILVLGNRQLAGTEPFREPGKLPMERKVERQVNVKVDKVVSIAIGAGASARMYIADGAAQPADNRTGTVQVDTIYRMAVVHRP